MEDEPNFDEHIFQMGWNHQLGYLFFFKLCVFFRSPKHGATFDHNKGYHRVPQCTKTVTSLGSTCPCLWPSGNEDTKSQGFWSGWMPIATCVTNLKIHHWPSHVLADSLLLSNSWWTMVLQWIIFAITDRQIHIPTETGQTAGWMMRTSTSYIPRHSMNVWHIYLHLFKFMVDLGKYTIHWVSGIDIFLTS